MKHKDGQSSFHIEGKLLSRIKNLINLLSLAYQYPVMPARSNWVFYFRNFLRSSRAHIQDFNMRPAPRLLHHPRVIGNAA